MPTHPRSTPRLTLLAALAASTVLAACGGGDGSPPDAGAPVAPPVAGPGPGPAPAPAPVPAPAPAPAPVPAPPPVSAAPVITTDLPATIVVREGEAPTLAVAATSPDGSALAYRWLRDGSVYGAAGTAAATSLPAHPFALNYADETWQAEVSNAAGTTASTSATLQRANRSWQDAGTAHPGLAAEVGEDGQLASLVDPFGRTHLASVHESPTSGTLITFKGVSKDSDSDAWAYAVSLPASAPGAAVSRLTMVSLYTGEMLASWLETVQGSVDTHVVHAALYRPGAAGQPGTWVAIGAVSDSAQEASEPSAVALAAGVFGIAHLQRSAAGQPRSAVLRRYEVPAAGSAPASGLGSLVPMESISADISRLHVVGEGLPMALLFVEAAGSTPAKWQYTRGAAGVNWSAPADLAVDDRFTRIDWAPPVNGLTVLATADGNGRLFTRRLDLNNGSFLDAGWSYTANAYGSPPALLIDVEGRIDVFGVSVATASGYTSVIGHWTFTPAAGWGAASVLAQSATDFRQNLGLRTPLAGRDSAGNLVLAWLERPSAGVGQTLRAQRYSSTSAGWTAPVTVAAPAVASTMQRAPTLSVNGTGRATAAWGEESGTGDPQVRHARLR